MTIRSLAILCLTFSGLAEPLWGQDLPSLKGVGSLANPPQPATAVHGQVPKAWSKDKATLVIFFSPLTQATSFKVPDFALIDQRNTGIELIAVSSESPEQIQEMIQEQLTMPRNIKLPTVLYDPDGRWRESLMKPTGRQQLPSAVAIDREGRIAWHGPATPNAVGYPTAMISANRWNIEKYIADIQLQALRQNNAVKIVNARRQARQDGDFQKGLDIYQTVMESDPKNVLTKLSLYEFMLMDMNEPERAYAYGRELAEEYAHDYITLNDLAWRVVSRPNIQTRDLDFAQDMSQRANALRGYVDYALLDTLARIHWMRGDRDRAVEWQRKATALAPDTWHGDSSRENLSVYVSGEIDPGTLPPPYTSPRKRR